MAHRGTAIFTLGAVSTSSSSGKNIPSMSVSFAGWEIGIIAPGISHSDC